MIAAREDARRLRLQQTEDAEGENKEHHPLDHVMEEAKLEQQRRENPSMNWVSRRYRMQNNTSSNDVPDLVNTSNDDSFLLNTSEESQANVTKPTPKWASFSTTFPKLSAIPPEGLNFLESSHLGLKVVSTQWTRTDQSSLQLGDVIIRLNGEDVSNLEADTVSQMMIRMDDCRIVTYLRKNVEL